MAKKKDDAEGAEGEEKKGGLGGKLKLLAMILPTVLLIGGAVYFFVLAPKSSATTATAKASTTAAATDGSTDPGSDSGADSGSIDTSTLVAGKVLSVDAVTVNLANGHFLKVGVGLQETADVSEDVSPAPAIDCMITEFSGKTVDQLATQAGRDAAKKELTLKIYKAYEKKVYKVYYNSFVMN
jgi:flagellar FliL protein